MRGQYNLRVSATCARSGARGARAFGLTLGAALLASAASGCSSCRRDAEGTRGAASAVGWLSPPPSASQVPRPKRRRFFPEGPRFAILAGKGIGPIRIGATVPTIERHMQAKCEELTETRCRYIVRAVDFELKDGVVQSLVINRPDRLAGGKDSDGNPRVYGVFNGMIPPDLMLGMTPKAIQDVLGAPRRIDKAPPNEQDTEEVHTYEGMILEYDRIADTGLLALGSIKIVK